MKGMVFVGCSFTHGHGLWNYANFSYIGKTTDVPSRNISSHMYYAKSKRFPRLVSNHFNTWEFVRNDYSGNDEDSVGLINKIFQIDSPIKYNNQDDFFYFEDISYVIFQTSYIDRCNYIIDRDTGLNVLFNDESQKIPQLIDLGIQSSDEYYYNLRKQWYTEIRNQFYFLEEKGIKCLFLSITDDYLDFINTDTYMKNKFIKLNYNNKKFNTIKELFTYDKTLQIKFDYNFFGKETANDLHPSQYCHEIIANSIIEKIESIEK